MRNTEYLGPSMPISEEIDRMKYRLEGETFDGKIKRISKALSDGIEHQYKLEDILGNMRFLPAGRVQNAMGSPRITTAYNCFVSGIINDSMDSIMLRATQAAETMRRGGGIGYDFSRIRPRGDLIKSLESQSSGPVSFMGIYDAICQTIASSGHRRGAQMGVLRVDHPDIYDFIRAKRNSDKLTGFNISVGITDKFMVYLEEGSLFPLEFEGRVYNMIDPVELWDEIMQSTWDWAEPGVLFLDRINEMNNLYYCEKIEATNPCGEQPLPPFGACLLGSFNLAKYVNEVNGFDYPQFESDIHEVVRAMDNVIDRTIYPLKEQEDEARNKRRMGLGVTGLANAGEMLGFEYGSADFLTWMATVFETLRDETYRTSAELAGEKGTFPLYNAEKHLAGKFIQTLSEDVINLIEKNGIRNSHLTSIAPTGTISLCADNVSGGIEPVFSHYYDRTIQTFNGPIVERVEDYAYSKGVEGKSANDISVQDHLEVLLMAQKYIDSACSKTCNVGDDVSYDEFKQVYVDAWKGGAKGCTTFRLSGKRFGIFNQETLEEEETIHGKTQEMVAEEGKVEACFIDPLTGQKECS